MKTVLAGFIAASIVLSQPSLAQTQDTALLEQPSRLALELARHLQPDAHPLLTTYFLPSADAQTIVHALFNRGSSRDMHCDRQHAECIRIAEEIAERTAAITLDHHREAAELVFAMQFDATMTDQEMRDAISFLSTPAGQSFAAATMHVDDELWARGLTYHAQSTPIDPQIRLSTIVDEFFERTASLPRADARPPVTTTTTVPRPTPANGSAESASSIEGEENQ